MIALNRLSAGHLTALLALALAVGCAGPAGKNGTDGTNGTNGATGPTGASLTADGGSGLSGPFTGQVEIVGGLDPSGATVTLQNADSDQHVTAGADGGFSFGAVPVGAYDFSATKTVTFPNSGFSGSVSMTYSVDTQNFIYLPGSDGYLISGDLYPFAPLEAAAGTQVVSGTVAPSVWSVSADNVHFAYALQTTSGDWVLQLGSTTGETPVTIGTVGSPAIFAFSPDGQYLAFISAAWQGEVVPIAGGAPIMLGPVTSSISQPLSFSADSHYLAYPSSTSASGATLLVTTLPSGSTVTVANNMATTAGQDVFQFAPQGDALQFATTGPALDVATPPFTAAPLQLATDTLAMSVGQFSPDGTHLVEYLLGAGKQELLSVSGGTPVDLPWPSTYAFSSDSAWLVASNSSETALVTVSTGATRVLSAAQNQYVGFSPDNSLVAYSSFSGNMYLAPVSGSGSTVQFTDMPSGILTAYFTPDSSNVMFFQGSAPDLVIAPVTGGTPRVISTTTTPWFDYTPDGSHIVFLDNYDYDAESGTLMVVPTAGGTPVTLAENATSLYLSPDGSAAVYQSVGSTDFWSEQVSTLNLVSTQGGTPIPLNTWATTVDFAGSTLLQFRDGTPAPYSFQDGIYLTPLP